MTKIKLGFIGLVLALVGVLLAGSSSAQDGPTLTADDPSSVELEVRIAARKLAGGRVEFGLQSRQADGSWSDRLLPEKRYFPTGTGTGSWLSSSPLTLQSVELEVRIVARGVAGGRVEFGLQSRQVDGLWGDRLLPEKRYFPIDTGTGRWLLSSSLPLQLVPQVGAGPVTEIGPVAPLEALTVEVTPTSLSATSFQVAVTFARPVTGFDRSDIVVSNGSVTDFSGSGAQYEVTVEPRAAGAVVVRIPKGVAKDATDTYNQASSPYVANSNFAEGPGFDTWNRAAVIDAMVKEFDRVEPDPEFTGNVENCIAGTTSQQFRDSVIQRVNWYRQMAGINPVSENLEYSKDAQAAALMMAAERELSHLPRLDWTCYTQSGARGAGRSNLYLGVYGINAVDGYIRDSGDTNLSVGHRMWILDPWATNFGTGDVPTGQGLSQRPSNALYVVGIPRYLHEKDYPEVRQERGFVAWPPPGYTTANTNWGRWSFSLEDRGTTDFNLSSAIVTVMDDDGPVQANVISRSHSSIVWAMNGDTNSYLQSRPTDGDHCYTIAISNILGEYNNITQAPYEYTTCIIDVGSQFNKEDREALIALYHSTDGPNWINNQNWLTNNPLETWYGVTVDPLLNKVLDLELIPQIDELGRRNLTGKLPSELGNLTKLRWLDLSGNQLSGPIPPEIGKLTELRSLSLSDNQLSGPIPPEIGKLTELRSLSLSDNQLSGPIPSELGDLTNLEGLGLGGNQLSGPIPPELGDLTKLWWLQLGGNQLSGPIPPELGDLTKLRSLSLGGNQLSGPIPPELGDLTNLEVLSLGGNQLSGPIPSELSGLTKLRWLSLYGNQLSGPLPVELANKFPDLL